MFRRMLVAALLGITLPVAAQQPPKLEPLPPPPPPPPGLGTEQPGEAPVRIEPGSKEQVEEQVIGGRRIVHVTTAAGTEYYLIEDLGGSSEGDSGTGSRVRVPLWVIRRF